MERRKLLFRHWNSVKLTLQFAFMNPRKQREYAAKILPVRKNGHLLLVTLLLGNMIVNETLPIIADPVLGGGVVSVVVSTVLIVMYVLSRPPFYLLRHASAKPWPSHGVADTHVIALIDSILQLC